MISVIFARDKNNLIGNNNQLPWNIPEDLKWFKEKTLNKKCIAGRLTWQSIGKVLPKRECHLLTKTDFEMDGLIKWNSIDNCLASLLNNNEEIFVIGGIQIWKQIEPIVQRYYITEINNEYEGTDWYIPNLSNFNKTYSNHINNLEFTLWERKLHL